MLTFNSVLAKAPLQLYCAGILFSPAQSAFRRFFSSHAFVDFEIRTQLLYEWSACIHPLEGHSGSVNSVVFSPDGSRVASGSDDNTVRVWDVQTGQCQHTLEGHSGRVNSVVFSPDGSRVASGSSDNTVRVWDIASTEEILCYNSGTYPMTINFSDGSTKIVVNGASLSIPSQTSFPRAKAGSAQSRLNMPISKLAINDDWVTLSSERILWLPPEYRPGNWASYGDMIVVGSTNGRVTFVRCISTGPSLS
jgi:WD40 repeat protein